MLTNTESEILLAAMKYVRMEGHFVLDISSDIIKKDGKIPAWYDIFSKNSLINEDLYEDWIEKNHQPVLLSPLSEKIKVQFLFPGDFASSYKLPERIWSVYFTITRPGIAFGEQTAILQVSASCPSGSPHYTSLLFLEKTVHFWNVKSVHGLV